MSNDGPETPSDEVDALRRRVAELEGRLAQSDAERERAGLFELAPDLLCTTDLQGRLRQINPHWQAVLGYTPGELLDRPIFDLVHPDDVAPAPPDQDRFTEGSTVAWKIPQIRWVNPHQGGPCLAPAWGERGRVVGEGEVQRELWLQRRCGGLGDDSLAQVVVAGCAAASAPAAPPSSRTRSSFPTSGSTAFGGGWGGR
jgi:PAS domain-containing protein